MKKVLVIGSINVDRTVFNNHNPLPGETVVAEHIKKGLGGKGANQAVAVSLCHVSTTFIFAIGKDDDACFMIDELNKYKINLHPIYVENVPSGTAFIMVDNSSGENIISVVPGANNKLEFNQEMEEEILRNDIILISQEIPIETIKQAIRFASLNQRTIILNPAPYKDIDIETLSLLDYVTPNEKEAKLLANCSDNYEKCAQKLLDIGIKNVLITLGSKGSYFLNNEEEGVIESIKVTAIDTTGAGDCFNGFLAGSLAKGLTLEKSLQMANKASGLSVTKVGASSSYIGVEEVEKYLL